MIAFLDSVAASGGAPQDHLRALKYFHDSPQDLTHRAS